MYQVSFNIYTYLIIIINVIIFRSPGTEALSVAITENDVLISEKKKYWTFAEI